ncbi:MAG TPA: hypothetical protein VK797_14215, partial [Tepidisphaeraceae bacterium]|nr:hypothetical protein [Tepidisphaeraceae bacterium]
MEDLGASTLLRQNSRSIVPDARGTRATQWYERGEADEGRACRRDSQTDSAADQKAGQQDRSRDGRRLWNRASGLKT